MINTSNYVKGVLVKDPAKCKITMWPNNTPGLHGSRAKHFQCPGTPVQDGLCLKHLGDRERLLKTNV